MTLSGNVTGTLSASVAGASASAHFLASLGAGYTTEWEWDDLDGSLFDQSFAIAYTLVPGGTTLTAPAEVELNLVSTLNVTGQSLGSTLSTGEADFYQAGAFLDLDVPAGVSWESASGVFLAPEPPRTLVLACALGMLIGLRRLHPRRLHPLH